MAKPFHRAFLLIAMMLVGTAFAAAQTPKIKLGFAKCAHCLPMSLTPGLAKGVETNDKDFLPRFPFLAPAHQGLLQGHGGTNTTPVPNIPDPTKPQPCQGIDSAPDR